MKDKKRRKVPRCIADVLAGFVRVSDEGTNPTWPLHTGTTKWKSAMWVVLEKCMGGISMRVDYDVFRYGKLVGQVFPSCSQHEPKPNLRMELTKVLSRYYNK